MHTYTHVRAQCAISHNCIREHIMRCDSTSSRLFEKICACLSFSVTNTFTHTCIVLHDTHSSFYRYSTLKCIRILRFFFIFLSYFHDISAHGVYYIPFNKYTGEDCQNFNLFVTCQPTGPSSLCILN